DGDGSHGSTSKTPSYTKSVSWHHYPGKGETACTLNKTARNQGKDNPHSGSCEPFNYFYF
ncbi:hypothetical protein, partial [Escherichia coli]|uniref:hypothetical protein n=1 Tax=Escherichia coli TaxID=562 RepID=UPI001BCEE9AB